MSLETYGLNLIHFYSLAGLSWELITDSDMHQMVEKSMCGGISNSHQYATWNHPSIDTYNGDKEPRMLSYQDANLLYS